MLNPTAESAPSGSPARAEVHDEGALYGEARSVFEAWWHAMVLLRPLTLRGRASAVRPRCTAAADRSLGGSQGLLGEYRGSGVRHSRSAQGAPRFVTRAARRRDGTRAGIPSARLPGRRRPLPLRVPRHPWARVWD